MTMKINMQISTDHSGVKLEDITKEQATELTRNIVGTKGPRKLIFTWGYDAADEVNKSIVPTPPSDIPKPEPKPEQELEPEPEPPEPTTTHTNMTDFPQAADNITAIEPIPTKEPVIFKQLDRISKAKLTKYIDIDVFNMGYHDQGDGIVVICYGTTKVYTSWEDMFKLPKFINNESIENLNNLKQVAIRHFRKWMADHPDLLPDGVDPDAEFRSAGVGSSVYPPASPAGQDFG